VRPCPNFFENFRGAGRQPGIVRADIPSTLRGHSIPSSRPAVTATVLRSPQCQVFTTPAAVQAMARKAHWVRPSNSIAPPNNSDGNLPQFTSRLGFTFGHATFALSLLRTHLARAPPFPGCVCRHRPRFVSRLSSVSSRSWATKTTTPDGPERTPSAGSNDQLIPSLPRIQMESLLTSSS